MRYSILFLSWALFIILTFLLSSCDYSHADFPSGNVVVKEVQPLPVPPPKKPRKFNIVE